MVAVLPTVDSSPDLGRRILTHRSFNLSSRDVHKNPNSS
jgi:hypothetical protein